MALQLVFTKEILYKSCNNIGFERLELIKTGSRALIADMLYIKAWTEVLILVSSVSVSIIFIHLIRAYF